MVLLLVLLVKLRMLTIKRLKELSIGMLAPKKKDAMMDLFKEFSPSLVYTFSDEISLLMDKIDEAVEYSNIIE